MSLGNLTTTTLTRVDFYLQMPMYLFLRNFSFSEVSSTVVCIPRFLGANTIKDRTISYNCAAQLFFFIFMGEGGDWILHSKCHCHMLPSASPCIIQPSWAGDSATCLCSVHGWAGFWPFSHPLCFSSSLITVFPMSLITFCVTISPFYNCLVQIHGF